MHNWPGPQTDRGGVAEERTAEGVLYGVGEGIPFRLNAVLQDSHVAFLLFQRQNVHMTSASLDHACVDGSFADTGVLMDRGSEEG